MPYIYRTRVSLARRAGNHLTPARKLLLTAAGMAAIAGPIVIATVNAPAGLAQTQAVQLRFEVASIKPVKEGGKGGIQILPGGRLKLEGFTLKNLISFAYDIREDRITGGPRWSGSAAYNIDAKPEHAESADQGAAAPGTTSWQRMEHRLQVLLAERFGLAFHKDVKEGPIYALVVARGGAKLQPTTEAGDIPPSTMRSSGSITGRAGTVRMLAALFSNWLQRPVEDRTGLTGRYDYKLEYAQETAPAGRGGPPDMPPEPGSSGSSGPSVFTALQEQLGLKLESTRGKIVTIVIDRAERPAN